MSANQGKPKSVLWKVCYISFPFLSIPIFTIHNNIHEQEYHSDKGPLVNNSFRINGPFHPVHNSVFGNELVLLIVGPRKPL